MSGEHDFFQCSAIFKDKPFLIGTLAAHPFLTGFLVNLQKPKHGRCSVLQIYTAEFVPAKYQ